MSAAATAPVQVLTTLRAMDDFLGSPLYWILVILLVAALWGANALRNEHLRRRGYWVRGGHEHDLVLPLIILVILAAVALPRLMEMRRQPPPSPPASAPPPGPPPPAAPRG